jgi:hypothetical protein
MVPHQKVETYVIYTTETLTKLAMELNHSDNRIHGSIISEGARIKAAI